MAKKKKETPIKVNQSALTLGGNVSLSIRKGNNTFKKIQLNNSATFRMFTGLLQFLRGDFELVKNNTSSYMPVFLAAGSQTPPTPTQVTQTSLIAEIPMGDRISVVRDRISINNDLEKATLTLTALIPYSSVNNSIITELGLYSTHSYGSNTLLARVIIPRIADNDYFGIKLDPGSSLFVEWDINLGN